MKKLEPWDTYTAGVKQHSISSQAWTQLPYNQAILLLSVYPREMKTDVHTKLCIQMFIAAFFIIAQK
jgi:hypothetical protein